MAPFHAMAQLKENNAGKDVNVTNKGTKARLPNRQIGLPLNSSFINYQNDHHLENTNNFDYVSPPSYTFKYYRC